MFDLFMRSTTVLSGFLTPIIAIFGGYIAYNQWRLNQATLREKLFDRRFQVFKETQSLLSEILIDAKFSNQSYWTFVDAMQRSKFLFGREISDYLAEIRTHASKLEMYQAMLSEREDSDKDTRIKNIELKHVEFTWLTSQLDTLIEKFEPYIGFKKHK